MSSEREIQVFSPEVPGVGYLHSELVGSALDGPGLRTVFWLSGCALRCKYCHNPDTWKVHAGRRVSVDELVAEARRYARFTQRAGGGVTLSGGEPLIQLEFCRSVLERVHASGIHTALDTNGYLGDRLSDADLANIDLVLLDLKSYDRQIHRSLTGFDPAPALSFARRLSAAGRRAWIRFVLVPGVTDGIDNITPLARFCSELENVERLEVLPFHQLGRHKWHALGIPYALEQVRPATESDLAAARAVFRREGVCCPD